MDRFFKFALIGAVTVGAAAGILGSRFAVSAQEMEPAHFVVQGGVPGIGNAEALIFAPQTLNVHRGDTVTWMVNGFHNIRFPDENGLAPLALIPGIDTVDIPQINPVVAFPTLDNGATYLGGPANSGLPAGAPGGPTDAGGVFSLVMDVEPGTYSYLCDVHPGMAGTINVVDNSTPVASPVEVMLEAKTQADATLALGSEAVQAQIEAAMGINRAGDDGIAHVQTGSGGTGRTTVNRYFGFTTVIEAGQTVSWDVPGNSVDPHTVTWSPLRGQDVAPIPQDSAPPILAFGPGFTPNLPENGEVMPGADFNSGLIFPGQSISLTFPEPGVYPFVCNIHPGMDGVVVVEPAS